MPLRGAHFGSQACQGMKPCVSYPEQVPRSDLPTGGRISFFLKAWEKKNFGCLDTLCRPKWVSNSITCPSSSVSFSTKMVYSYATRPCKTGNLERRSEIIASEASNRRSNEGSSQERVFQSYISGSEMVRGWRPVIDLSRLNQFVLCPHFKMETLNSIRQALQKGDWVTSLDLKDAYFHICVHHRSRRYLRFIFEGKMYQFRVLPFGLSVSPYVFTRVLKSVLSHVRRQGIRVHAYLDDWLQPSVSEALSWLHSKRLLRIILDLGFIPNWGKSELVPVQEFTFLGARFKLKQALIGPSQDNIVSLQQALTKLLGAKEASARQLYSILGQMESMASLLPLGKAFKRPLQWEFKERWCQGLALWDDKIPLGPWFWQSSESLDGHGGYNGHVSSSSSFSPAPSFHRFESGGLGGSHGQSHGIGSLVPVFQTTAHQCPRDGSSLVGSQSFCGSCQGSFGVASYRQHNSGGLCEQTGGDSFPNLVQPGSRDCVMVHSEQSSHQGQIFTWETQHSSGLLVQEREYCSNRMVSQSKSSISDISHLGQASSRFICNSSEQEATAVCVSCPGSRSICNRCTESELAGNVGIRISSISSDSSLSQENSGGGMFSVPYCSSLGGTSMVPSTSVTSGSSCSSPSFEEGSAVSTHFQNVASHPSGVPSSRLVGMQRHLQATGISEPVASRIYSAKRPSTNNLYDYRWKSWVDWCIRRKMDPFNPSVNMFGEFLISLHDKNFSPATVKGYRSAISTTLKQISSIDFSSQSVLSDVVRSFELERPRTRPHFPKWDLAVVLSALNSSPFEPLDSCGFKELTFKTVFLTALASGRRRSEIHALSCSDVQFSDQSVSLSTFPGFLAKNQLPSVLSSPISLPSLSGQDSLLCPVRALKIYLERVLSRRKGRKRLFISHLDSYDKEISCDTISRWIVQTIKLAYGTRKLNQVSVNAHEVRALASSWAWSNKVPLDDIVKAGFWSSENSFIKFYLRDVSIFASSLASLGPVVAAQAVVVPVTSVL